MWIAPLRLKICSWQLLDFLNPPWASGNISLFSAHAASRWAMIDVNIFISAVANAIGLKLAGSSCLPFLCNMTVSLWSQSDGISDDEKIRLNSAVSFVTPDSGRFFQNSFGMPSGPGALLLPARLKASRTSSSVISWSSSLSSISSKITSNCLSGICIA